MANLYSDCPPVTKITVERYPQSKYAAIIVPSNKRVPVDTKNRLNGERRIPITLDDVYGDSIYFFYVVGHEFPIQISDKNLSRLFFAVTYLGQMGYLVPNKNSLSPLTEDKLRDLMGLDENEFGDFYEEMIRNDIFLRGRTSTGVYATFVDETLFCHGGYPYYGLCIRLNISGIRALYRRYKDDPVLMSRLFRAMPHVSAYWNRVCVNPLSEPYMYLNRVTLHEFVEIVGCSGSSEDALLEALSAIRFTCGGKKQKAITFRCDNDEWEIMINPMLFCSNRSYFDNFDQHGDQRQMVVVHDFPNGALPPYRKVVRDDEGVTPEIRAIMEKFWEHGNKRRPWKEEEK